LERGGTKGKNDGRPDDFLGKMKETMRSPR
jgi:hypothetical protein